MSRPDEPDAEAPATGAQPAGTGFAGNPWRDAPSARRSAVPAPRRERPTTGTASPPAASPAAASPASASPPPASPPAASPAGASSASASSASASSASASSAEASPADAGPTAPDSAAAAAATSAAAPPTAAAPAGSELVPTGPGTSYADLIRRLAGAEADLARRRTAVHAWFARQQARAEAEVARTAQRVAEADSALGSAQAAVEFTEAETARLWQILAGRLRLRDPAQLGPPPGPDGGGEPVAEHPAHLLDRVRETLDQVRPVKRRRAAPLPLLLLAVIVLLAGVGYAAYKLAN